MKDETTKLNVIDVAHVIKSPKTTELTLWSIFVGNIKQNVGGK